MTCSQILRNSFETSLRLLRKFANNLHRTCDRGTAMGLSIPGPDPAKLLPLFSGPPGRLIKDLFETCSTFFGVLRGKLGQFPNKSRTSLERGSDSSRRNCSKLHRVEATALYQNCYLLTTSLLRLILYNTPLGKASA